MNKLLNLFRNLFINFFFAVEIIYEHCIKHHVLIAKQVVNTAKANNPEKAKDVHQ